jgi:trehalose 6-phosphate phosphatase
MTGTVMRRMQPGGAVSPDVSALARDSAWFLDIDGTLIDFAEHPDLAAVDAEIMRILNRLQVVAGGAVALVSGRSVAAIDRLFSPLHFAAAGQHGIERRGADGRLHIHAMPLDRLRTVTPELERLVAQFPDLVFENKGASLALHYRRAPAMRERVENVMHGMLDRLGGDFELQPGKMLVEIRPGGRDKGTAIAEFMAEPPFAGRPPVFIGDDLTDEYGFALVNSMHGHSFKVGAGATSANWRLADARAVRNLLRDFADHHAQGITDP